MTHLGYVLGGYISSTLVIAVYVARMRARSRALASILERAPDGDGSGGGNPGTGL